MFKTNNNKFTTSPLLTTPYIKQAIAAFVVLLFLSIGGLIGFIFFIHQTKGAKTKIATFSFQSSEKAEPLTRLSATKIDLSEKTPEVFSTSTQKTHIAFNKTITSPSDSDALANITVNTVPIKMGPRFAQKFQGSVINQSIIYKDVYPDTDITYTNYQDHIKEDIVLRSNKAPPQFTFFLSVPSDVTLTKDALGGINASQNGKDLFYIQPLTATDRANTQFSYHYQLQKETGGYILDLIPDQPASLTKAVYPILIDPTISWNFAQTSDYTSSNPAEIQISGNVVSLINNSVYPTDNPYVYTNNPVPYTTLAGFIQTLDATNQGTVQYQFSKDKSTWYWWDGSTWAVATPTDYTQSNTAAAVNTNIGAFATQLGSGNLYIKAFLHASSSVTPVALDSFTVTYTGPSAPAITNISPNSGTTAGGTAVTLTGTNFLGTAGTGGTITTAGAYTIHTFTSSGTFTPPSSSTSVEYLIVGGGGGGGGAPAGGSDAGGGGAGGLLSGTLIATGSATITVGGGGSGGDTTGTRGINGGNSVFGTIIATGGGGGGGGKSDNSQLNGGSGGSGGGGGLWSQQGLGGAGIVGQGNNGGDLAFATPNYGAGGGGGASAVGANGTSIAGGKGGNGITSSISGVSLPYAGGGGGGTYSSGTAGAGGNGGGGAGQIGDGTAAIAGTSNTGGGGGGAGNTNNAHAGSSGGSGIVIVRYLTGSGGSVTFGGAPLTNVQVVNPTTITGLTPVHATGAVDVTVVNGDTQSVTLTNGYTYLPFPTITSVTPSSVSKTGGNTITITGTNFISGATVSFGGISALSVNFIDANTLSVVTPAQNIGTYNVVITNPGGQSVTSTNGISFITSPPSLSSVSPNAGPLTGGTSVTLTGTNFAISSGVAATGGTITYTDVNGLNPRSSPAYPGGFVIHTFTGNGTFTPSGAGTVDVLVVAGGGGGGWDVGGGGGAGGLINQSSFAVTAQPYTVTVGTGGTAATSGTRGGQGGNSIFSTLTAIGGGGAGSYPSLLTGNSGGSGGGGGTTVGSQGVGGTGTAGQGNAGGTAQSGYSGNYGRGGGGGGAGAAASGPGGGNGLQNAIAGVLTYYAGGGATGDDGGANAGTPGLGGGGSVNTSGTPNTGGGGGGAGVTPGNGGSGIITIRYHVPTLVTIGGLPATNISVVNPTTITASTAAHTAGLVDVLVTNPDGMSATLSGGFTYNPPPGNFTVSPSSVLKTGGNTITITGSNFFPTSTVTFGGIPATSVLFVNATTLNVVTPVINAGVYDIKVINPDGQSATQTNGMTFTELPPTLSAISPNFGPASGGTIVTLTGANIGSSASDSFTKLLLHGDGVNNATTFTDSATLPKTVTAGGGAKISTGQSEFGGASGVFDGVGSYLSIPSSTDFSMGTGDFSVDFWVRFADISSYRWIVGESTANNFDIAWYGPTSTLNMYLAGTLFTVPWTPSVNTWYHVAVTRASNNLRVFANGNQLGSTQTSNSNISATGINIGKQFNNTNYFNGYLDELRISKGIARWTANFTPPTSPYSQTTITLGGTSATNITTVNATTTTASTSAHTAGVVDVVVTNGDGQSATLAGSYTYKPPPGSFTVSPSSVIKTGGDSVTINGSNFVGTPTVTFGGTAGTSVNRVDANTLTVTTPAHAAGVSDVVVTNPDGQSYTLTNGITFAEAHPNITAISPNSGPTSGGTSVTITGSNFTAGASATGGTISYTDADGLNPRSSPPYPGGYVVHTFTGNGTFTPSVTGNVETLVVAGGGAGGGGDVGAGGGAGGVLNTTSYAATAGTPIPITIGTGGIGVAVASAKGGSGGDSLFGSLRAIGGGGGAGWGAGAGVAGGSGGAGAGSSPGGAGTVGQGYAGGNGLSGPDYPQGGGGGAGGVGITAVTQLKAGNGGIGRYFPQFAGAGGSPAGWFGGGGGGGQEAGTDGANALTGNGGQGGGGNGGRQYSRLVAQPGVANTGGGGGGEDPDAGGKGGSGIVIVRYRALTLVTIGGAPATNINVLNATTITASTSAHIAGIADVVVTNYDGQSTTLPGGYTYLAPTISGISPSVGPTAGGTNVTITGANFSGTPTVTIGGASATNVTVVNPTTITATTPAHTTGAVDVVVTDSIAQSGTATGIYTYHPPPGTFTVSPSSVLKTGGNTVTITGSDFVATPSVTFGGIAATSVSWINATTLSVVTPVINAGTYNVIVTNPDGQSTMVTNGITFVELPPIVSSISPNAGPAAGGTNVTITGINFLGGSSATGGTITYTDANGLNPRSSQAYPNGYIVHTFTGSGTFTPSITGNIDVLVVAGGGAGGTTGASNDVTGGGGGAGGVLSRTAYSVSGGVPITVTIGNGGISSQDTVSTAGNNSVFGSLIAIGGGRGAGFVSGTTSYYASTVGGSGGGGAYYQNPGSSGTTGQGNAGGSGTNISNPGAYAAGGGGGAGAVGQNQNGAGKAGDGGAGIVSVLSGLTTYYAGGGGGGAGYQNQAYSLPGNGGVGGGGIGSRNGNGTAGTANTGGGGGGSGNSITSPYSNAWGGNGGSGIVIVRYRTPTLVTFGGVAAGNVAVVNSTTITATTPAHAGGTVDVSVTNPDGQSATLSSAFTYMPDKYIFTNTALDQRETQPGTVTVLAADINGNVVSVPSDVTLTLSSSSQYGFFARDLNEDSSSRWIYTTVTIPAGQSSATFYYKDNLKGTPTLAATPSVSIGGLAATQIEHIRSQFRFLVTGITNPVKSGIPSSLFIQAVDYNGSPVNNAYPPANSTLGTIHFTTTDANAVVPPDFIFPGSGALNNLLGRNTFVNGVTMVTQNQSSGWCVTVTDASDSDITGSQCGIQVGAPNAGASYQLKFINTPQSFGIDSHSSGITIQMQDVDGAPVPVTATTSAYLYSTSTTAQFSLSGSSNWSSTQPYQIKIQPNTTAATFYYQDATVGPATMTVKERTDETTDDIIPIKNDSQNITVGVGVGYKFALTIPQNQATISAMVIGGPYTASLEDINGNVVTTPNDLPMYVSTNYIDAELATKPDLSDAQGNALLTHIAAGNSTQSIYFRNRQAGTQPVTLSDFQPPNGNAGLLDDTKSITVLPLAASKLLIDTAPFSLSAGAVSNPITFSLHDQYDNYAPVASASAFYLSTSQPGGFFSATAGFSSEISSVTIPAKSYSATVYFKQKVFVSPQIITVSDATPSDGATGIADISQTETILSGNPTKFIIASPSAVLAQAGNDSGQITIQTQNQYGIVAPLLANTQVYFYTTSSSSTKNFSLLNGAFWSPITSTLMPQNTSSLTFYYKDTLVGNSTITVSDDSQAGVDNGLTNAALPVTISGGTATTLRAISNPQTVAAGQVTSAITVQREDVYQNPSTSGSVLTLTLTTTASGSGSFDTAAGGAFNGSVQQVTIPANASQVTFYYKDSVVGTPTITASAVNFSPATQQETITSGSLTSFSFSTVNTVRTAGQVSTALIVKTLNQYGIQTPVSSPVTINVTSTQATEKFDTDFAGPFNGVITSVTIPGGASSAFIYYKDTKVGSPTITGATGSYGSHQLVLSIIADTVSNLVITSVPQTLTAGQKSTAISFEVRDQYGNLTTIPAQAANLTSNSPTGIFYDQSGAAISALSLTSQGTFYYKDTVVGTPTLSISTNGLAAATQQETITAGAVSSIDFSTVGTVQQAGQVSTALVIKTFNQYGIQTPVSSPLMVNLISSQATGRFDTDFAGPFDGSITSSTIPGGASSAFLYYRDTKVGSATLTTSAVAYTAQQLSLTIVPDTASKLVITSNPQTLEIGQKSASIGFSVEDQYGNPTSVTPSTATLTSTTGSGIFSDVSNNPITTVGFTSQGTLYYTDTAIGTPTITLHTSGLLQSTQQETIVSGNIASLSVDTTSTAFSAGSISGQVTVKTLNQFGTVVTVPTDLHVTLTSSQTSGKFDTSAGGLFDGSITGITIASGSSSATFYYKDTKAGSATVTIAAASYASKTVAMTISTGTATKLAITSNPQTIAIGQKSGAITFAVQDQYGNQVSISAQNASLTSDSVTGSFLDQSNQPITNLSITTAGTFYYKDLTIGNSTITIHVSGLTDVTQQQTIINGSPTNLQLTTQSTNSIAGAASQKITVTALNAFNQVIPVQTDTVVTLISTSTSGGFDTDASGAFQVTTVTIPAGSSSTDFYYRNTATGSQTITANSSGLTQGALSMTVDASTVFSMVFVSGVQSIAAGTGSSPISIQFRDVYGNSKSLDSITHVDLTSDDITNGAFSATSQSGPWNATSIDVPAGNAAAFVFYRDTKIGTKTMTISATGLVGDSQAITIFAAGVSSFGLITGPQTMIAGIPSSILSVQAYDTFGNQTTLTSSIPLTLTVNTGTGTFSQSQTSWVDTSSIMMQAGTGVQDFFFKDTKAGMPIITVHPTSYAVLTQQETIVAAAATQIQFTTATQRIVTNTPSNLMTLQVSDGFGNASTSAEDRTVTLTSSSTGGEFSTDGISGWASSLDLTIAAQTTSGTFFYRDSVPASPVITAASTGLTHTQQTETVVNGSIAKVVVNGATSVQAGQISPVTIQTLSTDDLPVAVQSSTQFTLPAAGSGQFSLSQTNWVPVSSVSIPSGQYQTTLYFKDTSSETVILTATESPSVGWSHVPLTLVVDVGAYAKLKVLSAPTSVNLSSPSAAITIQTQDIYGNVVTAGATTYLYGPVTGMFATNQGGPWNVSSLSILPGLSTATFYYQDSFPGAGKTLYVSDNAIATDGNAGILDVSIPMIVSGQSPQQLRIIAGTAQTISAGTSTNQITVQAQRNDGSPTILGQNLIVSLVTLPANQGAFKLSPAGGAITQISIPIGSTSATFYYTHTVAGTYQITTSGTGVASDMTPVTVIPDVAKRLVFMSAPQTKTAGTESAMIRVALQDAYANLVTATTPLTLTLSTTGTGEFSVNPSPSWNPVTSVQIAAGANDVYFYYKGLSTGTHSLQADESPDAGLTAAAQNYIVSAGVVTKLLFTTATQNLQAGQASSQMSLTMYDIFGNVSSLPQSQVFYFYSTDGQGSFSTTAGFASPITSQTIPAGTSTFSFYYKNNVQSNPDVVVSDQSTFDDPVDIGITNARQTETISWGAATKITIIGGSTLIAGIPQSFTTTITNAYGIAVPLVSPKNIYFYTTTSGQFSQTGSFPPSDIVTSLTVPAGTSSAQFSYRDTSVGNPTITISDSSVNPEIPDLGVQNASKLLSVQPAGLSQFAYTTTAQSLETGQGSSIIRVQTRDSFGNVVLAAGPITAYLYSSSTTGMFSQSSNFSPGNLVTRITIPSGTSMGSFYYQDTSVGNPTLTVSDATPQDTPDTGIGNATAIYTVSYGNITQLQFTTPLPTIIAGGIGTLTVKTQNAQGIGTPVISDTTIRLQSTSGTGSFSLNSGGPWTATSVTILAGSSSAQLYYRDPTPTTATVTASNTGWTNAQGAITTTAGTATQMRITSLPQTITAKHPSGQFTVTVQNEFGVPYKVTSPVTVYLRSNSSDISGAQFSQSATGPWGLNSISISTGSSSTNFYYHDSVDGTAVITASDNSDPAQAGTLTKDTQPIIILRQVIDHLLVTNVSTPQNQGDPSSLVVAAVDSGNFIVEWYSGTIALTSSDSDAVLPAQYIFKPSIDKGIHTFGNSVAFLHTGVKSVNVIDTTTPAIAGAQTAIVVNTSSAGPIKKLKFITGTSLVINKNTASSIITVQSQDVNDKPSNAPTGGYPIHLTSNSGTGTFSLSQNGPWTNIGNFTIPENLNSINIYYRGGTAGTATVTAADWNSNTDDPGIDNDILNVLVNGIAISVIPAIIENNVIHQDQLVTILFPKDYAGYHYGRGTFATSFSDELSGQPASVSAVFTLNDPSGNQVKTQTVNNISSYSFAVDPIENNDMNQGNYTLTVSALDTITGITGTQSVAIPVSGWALSLDYTLQNIAVGQTLPYVISTKFNSSLTDPAFLVVNWRDSNGNVVTGSAYSQHLSDMTRDAAGQYHGNIGTTGLTAGLKYFLYAKVYDINNATLAENTHLDVQMSNSPALAPRNFRVTKVLKSVPPASEQYDLQFNWQEATGAATYNLYRSRNKTTQLFDDPCTVAQISFGHRYGDPGGTTPYCETKTHLVTGTDDSISWVKMDSVNAPASSLTIPWSQIQTDLPNSVYYYLLLAENGAGESGYSTMVFSLKKPFVNNISPQTNVNWISLPYYPGNFTNGATTANTIKKASDIVTDIEGSITGAVGNEKNKKIDKVAPWNGTSQNSSGFYTYNPSLHRWTGADFSINPGDPVYLQTTTPFDWTIVGNDIVSSHTLTYNNTPQTNVNWMSFPYTGKYMKASDIVSDIEGSLIGSVGNEKNRKIDKIAPWSSNNQNSSGFFSYSPSLHRWTGADFPINPGDIIYLQLSGLKDPVEWVPVLILNPYQ